MVTFQPGDTVHFICAQQIQCKNCNQYVPDLDYSIQQGMIVAFQEYTEARWPHKEIPCGCKEDCFCARKTEPDYLQKPNVRIHIYYTLKADVANMSAVPESCLYAEADRAQIEELFANKQFNTAVMVRPSRTPIHFTESIEEASLRPTEELALKSSDL